MEPLDMASLLAEPAPLSWERLQATNSPLDELPPGAGDELDQALPWLVRHLGVADALALVMAADGEAAAAAGLSDEPAANLPPGRAATAPEAEDPEALARAMALAEAEARAEAEALAARQALAEAEALAAAEARALAALRHGQAVPADLDDLAELAALALHAEPAASFSPADPPATQEASEAPEAPADDAGRLLGALGLLGYSGRLQVQPLADLSPLQLPMLLLLRCGDACVLTRLDDRHAERLLRVVMPGQPPVAFDLPEAALEPEYTGAALLLQRLDDSAPLAPPAAAEGPLGRLAQALHAALGEPVPEPTRWQRLWGACKGLLGRAGARRGRPAGEGPAPAAGFKFAPGRPISG